MTLDVFNLQGKLIKKLANGVFDVGGHMLFWNAKNNSSGIYIIKAQIGGKNIAAENKIFKIVMFLP